VGRYPAAFSVLQRNTVAADGWREKDRKHGDRRPNLVFSGSTGIPARNAAH
jgi:hypothetical protein